MNKRSNFNLLAKYGNLPKNREMKSGKLIFKLNYTSEKLVYHELE